MAEQEIAQTKTFEQKMSDRIRDSIGDLIDDEALSKLVEKGIEDAFFKERRDGNIYNSRTIEPLMTTIVKDLMKEKVNEEVKEWFKNNPDKIKEIFEEVVKLGVGQAVMNAISQKLQWDLQNFTSSMIQSLQRG